MKALLVYESVYGNTEKVAQAIGEALGSQANITILRLGEVRPEHLANIDMLVVGSPTQAFRPLPAVKKWLESIPKNGLKGVKAAAFDTRIAPEDTHSRILPAMVKMFGYAAKPIADDLQKKGGELILPPEGFFVEGTEGPLKPGELERAASWAKGLLEASSNLQPRQ